MGIFGVDLVAQRLEPLGSFEPFLPADVDSPPIFEETKLLLLKDLIIPKVGSFLSR